MAHTDPIQGPSDDEQESHDPPSDHRDAVGLIAIGGGIAAWLAGRTIGSELEVMTRWSDWEMSLGFASLMAYLAALALVLILRR